MTDHTAPTDSVPIACILHALTPGQRNRRQELWERIQSRMEEIRSLVDGYALRFKGKNSDLVDLAEWISLERICCPFFRFTVEIPEGDLPCWLRITGREGVKEFLADHLKR